MILNNLKIFFREIDGLHPAASYIDWQISLHRLRFSEFNYLIVGLFYAFNTIHCCFLRFAYLRIY
jgi:hypothetical protein